MMMKILKSGRKEIEERQVARLKERHGKVDERTSIERADSRKN